MRIFFSGIGGSGIGPLALLASDAGFDVLGSDIAASDFSAQLEKRDITVLIGQDGSQIKQAHADQAIDWLVYTPALNDDHPELQFAAQEGIRVSKSGEFINHVLKEKQLKLVAMSGTHGKTTSTAMMSWLFHRFEIPSSYIIGSEVSWGPSARYEKGSEYLILEADEYDKKMLDFSPYSSVISSIDYDHPDTYPTVQDYKDAFIDFIADSHCSYLWREDAQYLELDSALPHCAHVYGAEEDLSQLRLAGEHNRHNAFLVAKAFAELFPTIKFSEIIAALNDFPGSKRRFEKLADNVYTDYAHHPREIEATLEMASAINPSVVAIYQPHQNVRQHQLMDDGGYGHAFDEARTIYWLPTYLSREDPNQEVLQPKELIRSVAKNKRVTVIDDRKALIEVIKRERDGSLIVCMGAGSIDEWVRSEFASND